MRVPIENGSGFINQVLDFIKLPALPEQRLNDFLSENNFSCGQVFIFGKYVIHI